ncbi:MAG TPA: hypothetical protein VM056_07255 [Terriglobales bacterium]|nr:hypothetical protein [Terriglobales bacterium]
MNLRLYAVVTMVCLITSGCSMQVKDHEKGEHKNVRIETPLGGLKVRTDDVEAKDAGFTVYPGAVPKEKEGGKDEKKANVNIDTPWFGVKVVALTYESSDPTEQVWEYYKKEMSKYGRVLECRSGSPDLKLEKQEKDDLTCREDNDKHINVSANKKSEMQLKVGTQSKQRIVAFKPNSKGTEFSLVFVATREGKETL